MKICMVSDTYYPYVGGIPEHIYNLSQILRTRGHIVKVLTTNFKNTIFKTLSNLPDENHTYRIGTGLLIRANKSFARLSIGWRLSDKIEKFFEKEHFEILHIHGVLPQMLPVLAIRHSKSVNVITFHASHPKGKKYFIFYRMLEPYIRKLHGRIAVSQTAFDSNMYYFSGHCRLIPNAINIATFNPSVKPLVRFSDDRPKILFLGRFEPRKGLKYLIKALPIVKKQIPNVLLIVCGAGLLGYAYREYISKEVKGNIHFAGLISSEERPHYYASCDVFCAPSIGYESFGIVLLEAMASGKPVVASNISGYRTIVEDGKEGLLAKPQSPDEIAGSLIKILTDRALAKNMGEAGRLKALKYSWEEITPQIEDFYSELLNNYLSEQRKYITRN